jgi:signal peptidase I
MSLTFLGPPACQALRSREDSSRSACPGAFVAVRAAGSRASGDTLTLMSDDGAAWRERTGEAWMSGSGARDGFGSPPWGPADPVPELDDTQALPGLGPIPGPGQGPRPGPGPGPGQQPGWSSNGYGHANGAGPGDPRESFPGGEPDAGTGPGLEPGAGAGDSGTGTHRRRARRRRSFWRELPVLVIVALVLALVIKSFAIQAFFIPSASMQNTLAIGDRVLINKIVYHLRPIHRGDIIVFDGTGSWDYNNPPQSSNIFSKAVDELEGIVGISHDSSIYIKRVIGLPGDHVKCCDAFGRVTVNGVPLSESSYLYPENAPSTQTFSLTVPPGRLWVMGDHRAISYDSRGHEGDPGGGTIPESGVLGRAFVIIWPPSRWGFLNIPATFEQPQLNAPVAAGGNAAAGGSSAALDAALDNGTPVTPATSPLPLALGFVGAVPLTWLQRRARMRLKSRRNRPRR